jgi:hypothetical protein
MRGARFWIVGALGAGLLGSGTSAGRADELPPGPNREVVERECQACHDANYFASTNRDRESWNSVIEEMIDYGARFDAQDRTKILDYLATALGPRR